MEHNGTYRRLYDLQFREDGDQEEPAEATAVAELEGTA
jgi:hypothetical protein